MEQFVNSCAALNPVKILVQSGELPEMKTSFPIH